MEGGLMRRLVRWEVLLLVILAVTIAINSAMAPMFICAASSFDRSGVSTP